MNRDPTLVRNIAVIGGGIAGLGAVWSLARQHRVTLYDGDSRFGGHAHTVDIDDNGKALAVDTGFIVYNGENYPYLVALFEQLGVTTAPSDMSFGVSLDNGRVEYSGSDLNGLFAQRRNTLRPRFWRMLTDIRRFYAGAESYLDAAKAHGSIGELLQRERYSDAFIDDHLVPMAAAIWSASVRDIRDYPADAFIRFFKNHGLLNLVNRPQWRTVAGGSRNYVQRLLEQSAIEQRVGSAVVSLQRHADSVTVIDIHGHRASYDEVVVATHADQALALLADPDADERESLGAFRYSKNVAWLHQDNTLMPRRRAAWSSWNYLQRSDVDHTRALSVSYWMNRLQPLATNRQFFVTLNPATAPQEQQVHGCYRYEHPLFTDKTASAQQRSAIIQGRRRTWYCGSYLGHGFHEDALQSGLWVAARLGAAAPWSLSASFDRLPRAYLNLNSRAA